MNPFKVPSYVCQGHVFIDEASRWEVLYGTISLPCCVQQLTNNAQREKIKKCTLTLAARKQNSWWGVWATVVHSQPIRKPKCYARKMSCCFILSLQCVRTYCLLTSVSLRQKKKTKWKLEVLRSALVVKVVYHECGNCSLSCLFSPPPQNCTEYIYGTFYQKQACNVR